MKKLIFLASFRIFARLAPIVMLTSCTTIKENGKTVFSTCSDVKGLHFKTAAGTTFDADSVDNSSVHTAVGSGVSKGVLSVGTAVMTSGIAPILK